MKSEALRADLNRREQEGLYRRRRIVNRIQGCICAVDGREVVDFSSNDYLGLAKHPDVVAAFKHGADVYGVGSTASHLVCGHSPAHHALEEELADFVGRDRALLFSTGYMANLGVLDSLAKRSTLILEDRLNHASLLDGARLAGARLQRYRHCDIDDLKAQLVAKKDALVVTDGVFSMDGDVAPLSSLAHCAAESESTLMVDDAHGLGIIGKNGAGTVESFQLTSRQVPLLMGTLGKALGTFGAFVAADGDWIEYLIQKARTYVYTTALPPAVAEATRASLKLVRTEDWRREKLRVLINRFRAGAMQLGLPLAESTTPIQPVVLGENDTVLRAGNYLNEAGFMVVPIRPPTVQAGSARLRVTISASHEVGQIDNLLEALGNAVR